MGPSEQSALLLIRIEYALFLSIFTSQQETGLYF